MDALLEGSGVEVAGNGRLMDANRHPRGQFLVRSVEGGAIEVWEWKAPIVREGSSFLENIGSSKIPM